MALPCGKKAEAEPHQPPYPVETVANRFWRGVGFVTMVAASLCIVAAVLLLPSYAKLERVRHQRDIQAVSLEEARRTLAAKDRLIREAPGDEVLTQRLAWSRLGLYPARQTVVVDPDLQPAASPGTLSEVHLPLPPAPDTALQSAAARLETPRRRRGLLVLAATLMLGAVLIFGPPGLRIQRVRGLVPPAITLEAKRAHRSTTGSPH